MSNLTLSAEQVQDLVPSATDIHEVDRGGQKTVFSCVIEGQKYALKVIPMQHPIDDELNETEWSETHLRAHREIDAMQRCISPHIVKMGPIRLNTAKIQDLNVLYYCEEFIEGRTLSTILKCDGPMPIADIIQLALQMSRAIEMLWSKSIVHRDIKPKNIIKQDASNNYILLDLGYIYNPSFESISFGPVGTPSYFSPEQWDFSDRKTLDHRSDQFSLGVVLYEMVTGIHPFWNSKDSLTDICRKISTSNQEAPKTVRFEIPDQLNSIIMRLLSKKPALRYRKIEMLTEELCKMIDQGGA